MKLKTKIALFFAAFSIAKDLPAQSEKYLQIGSKAPEINGIDQNGKSISSSILLKSGPVVLMFYRGNWCPYCQKQLSELQDSLMDILNLGAHVIVVTPEKPAGIRKMIGISGAAFSILHDEDYRMMKAYGVDFKLSKETVPRFYTYTINHTRSANGNKDDILPVPATYIINQQGIVKWVYYNIDYRERPSVEDIVRALKTI